MRSGLKVCMLILALGSRSASQTTIPPGDVSGTWTALGSPYLIQGDIVVPADSTLRIDPGVIVEFQGHFALHILGRLLAEGTALDSILFTVNDTTGFSNPDTSLGGWRGIRLVNTPPTSDSTILSYCRLQYGKAIGPEFPHNAGGAVCVTSFNKVRISDCSITRNMAGEPMAAGGGGIAVSQSSISFTRNVVAENLSLGQGGGIFVYASDLECAHNRIMGNVALAEGGGVMMVGMCTPTFCGDSIIGNRSESNGGGMMMVQRVHATLDSVALLSNSALWGGGAGAIACTVTATACRFSGNRTTLRGGGLAADFSSIALHGSELSANRTVFQGGGMHLFHSDLHLQGSSLFSNAAGNDSINGTGGGINAEWGTVRIERSFVARDTAHAGGGLWIYNCDVAADSVEIRENLALSDGGGLLWSADSMFMGRPYALHFDRVAVVRNTSLSKAGGLHFIDGTTVVSLSSLRIDRCELRENTAETNGAALFAGGCGEIRISNSMILDNVGTARTAGVTVMGDGHTQMFNCVVAGNRSGAPGSGSTGGALSAASGAHLDVVNCTFGDNGFIAGSALSARRGGIARVANSVFWGNTGNPLALVTVDTLGATLTVNYCDIQHGTDSILVSDSLSTLIWGVGNINAAPLFADTINRNYRLLPASPCIGTGIDSILVDTVWQQAPAIDIEGLPRPSPAGTRPDMGAHEEQVSFPAGGIDASEVSRPTVFSLDQNYPNPFNPATTIRFAIPRQGNSAGTLHATYLQVLDILGRKVATLADGPLAPGTYTVRWDATGAASGIYFCRMTSADFTATVKMVVLR